ncbi:MAG: T9SS type A sorting domain-containing protein [Siphonobacter aquaeclarae]|nr:T9SS type A sorting domain-containing protein [Siphonobacter aquaeclarae]
MKKFLPYIKTFAFALAFIAGLGSVQAQTNRDLLLTGGPDQGVYAGYPTDGVFDLNFMNVSGTNPSTTTPLPGGSLQIVLALPPGFAFADTYTPPAGWSYVKSGTTSAVLVQTGDISSSPPASIVSFSVPFKTTAVVNEGVWSAQIQRVLPTYQDTNPGNNTPNGTVSVTDKALPVELVYFRAVAEGERVALSWQTAKEINSDYFDIQRSADGRSWNKIGSVAAAGESSTTRNYTFSDGNPVEGTGYYRLLMADRDKTAKYSPVRSVVLEGRTELSLYPNPATQLITLKAGNWEEVASVQMVSAQGRPVYRSEGNPSRTITVDTLPAGLYIVQIKWNNGIVKASKVQIVR